MSIKPRTEEQLKLMRKSGEITAKALKKTLEASKPGVTMAEIDRIAEEEIVRLGAKPSFMTVPGYKWTTCLTINNEVVHGIPRNIVLQKGDVFSIDIGAVFKGWHTDAAWSIIVGDDGSDEYADKRRFLKAGEEAMWAGTVNAVHNNRIGDISHAMQVEVEEKGGYKVVHSLVGHGVGKELHEDPEVPGYGKAGKGLLLRAGVTIAIESIYTETTSEVVLDEDGWTICSADGSLGGLFEMSVIVGKEAVEVLTDWRNV